VNRDAHRALDELQVLVVGAEKIRKKGGVLESQR
jgi:hypothetical protein